MTTIEVSAPSGFLFASFGHRAVAFAFDCLPPLVLGYLAFRFAHGLAESAAMIVALAVVAAFWFVNRVVGVAFFGRSLGKTVTGLTIARTSDLDRRPGLPVAFTRELLTLLFLIPGVFALSVFFASNPAVDPVGGFAALAIGCALLLPFASINLFPLRQCLVTDGVCRTVVLAD